MILERSCDTACDPLTQEAIFCTGIAIFLIPPRIYDRFDQHGSFRRKVAAAWYRSTMTLLKRAWQTYKELTTPALRRMCTRAFVRSRGMTGEERSREGVPRDPEATVAITHLHRAVNRSVSRMIPVCILQDLGRLLVLITQITQAILGWKYWIIWMCILLLKKKKKNF